MKKNEQNNPISEFCAYLCNKYEMGSWFLSCDVHVCVLAFSAWNPRINRAMNQITEEKKEKIATKIRKSAQFERLYQKAQV